MEIKKNIATQNFNKGNIGRINYVVIHYTANNGDTALGNTNYFKSYRGSSAHYFIDENNIYQSVEDKNIAWHCGANSYKHPYCRNSNSIGIELCSRKNSDGTYYFIDKTVDNAVWLTKYLMAKYNIPVTNVIRHYDVTGKICPEPFVRDSKAWNAFKNRLVITKAIEEEIDMVENITISINGKNYKANRILKDGKNYICLKDLEQASFIVGYDVDTKVPSIANKPKELQFVVNGIETSVEAVNINGSNYVPIRSLAAVTGAFDVDYKDGRIVVKTKLF
ncbi:MAG: peptidoglycan recognition family protein [Clostridia bacterium]|nr:peptidoglycan recognition family protein [Clostridia bacterium]